MLINKVMKVSLSMGEKLKGWEQRWSEERRIWKAEKAELLARIAELEEASVRQS